MSAANCSPVSCFFPHDWRGFFAAAVGESAGGPCARCGVLHCGMRPAGANGKSRPHDPAGEAFPRKHACAAHMEKSSGTPSIITKRYPPPPHLIRASDIRLRIMLLWTTDVLCIHTLNSTVFQFHQYFLVFLNTLFESLAKTMKEVMQLIPLLLDLYCKNS